MKDTQSIGSVGGSVHGRIIPFSEGQVWHSANGEWPRCITDYRSAGLGSKYPPGTMVVDWAQCADRSGRCTAGSFRQWIARTDARLHGATDEPPFPECTLCETPRACREARECAWGVAEKERLRDAAKREGGA